MGSSASSCVWVWFSGLASSTAPASFGSLQFLPFVSYSVPTRRVVRLDLLGTVPSLDPEVDVIEHVEHLI